MCSKSKTLSIEILILLVLGLLIGGCAPEDMSIPTTSLGGQFEEIVMDTHAGMAGTDTHLTISADGSIVHIKIVGLRHFGRGGEATKTTRTGRLQEGELDYLLKLFKKVKFNAEGKYDASSDELDEVVHSELTLKYDGKYTTIIAYYDPIILDDRELKYVPKEVRGIYRELRYIIENRTTEVSQEKIPIEK